MARGDGGTIAYGKDRVEQPVAEMVDSANVVPVTILATPPHFYESLLD
jgi:hypothetical protein